MDSLRTAAVILAAGAARRMGQVKQLLEYQGKPMIGWAIEKAISLDIPVIVVLGAASNDIISNIDAHRVNITVNHHWARGISSSIHIGIQSAMTLVPGLSGVMLVLADQPGISSPHLLSLLKEGAASGKMVATEYMGSLGVPAYIPVKYFENLLKLTGDQGAKKLLNESPGSVIRIPFEPAAMDIDTRQDWLNFLQGNSEN